MTPCRPVRSRSGRFSTPVRSPKMSLPGLQLEAPVETGSTPTIHDIKENSEWRFEVAFGSKVEVKVGGNLIGILQNTGTNYFVCDGSFFPGRPSCLGLSSLKSKPTLSMEPKQQYSPGMDVVSKSPANAKSSISLRKPP